MFFRKSNILFRSLLPLMAVAEGVAAATSSQIASPVPNTILKSTKYHFKKDKLGVKRPTVELAIPVPTVDAIPAMLSDPKQTAFLLSLLEDAVYQQGREQVGDEKAPVNKQEELDLSKLTIEYIASIPPSERRGGGISKESWEEFAADYIAVMPGITGKNAEQLGNAAKLFVARLQPVKTNKKVLKFLQEQLDLWFASTQNAEDFADVYEFLSEKVKTFLSADEAALLANL